MYLEIGTLDLKPKNSSSAHTNSTEKRYKLGDQGLGTEKADL